MQPLFDGDVLTYEIGFAAEHGWQGEGIPVFDYVEELLTQRIDNIAAMVGANQPPLIYLTGDNNFRFSVAKTKPYKGNRDDSKRPFHYTNIRNYLMNVYRAELVHNMEADDMLAIVQVSRLKDKDTIICTRDKDLRQVPGWHYSWELGKQPEWGPVFVEENPGTLLNKNGKVTGTGLKWFYCQMLTGDTIDNIPGLPSIGPAKAFKILSGCNTHEDIFKAVRNEYRKKYREGWRTMMLEQGRLLWMCREVDKHNKPKMWELPY